MGRLPKGGAAPPRARVAAPPNKPGIATMKYSTRHFLFAAVSSLSLAACAMQSGTATPPPVAAAPALTGAPLDTSIPSQLPRIAAPLHYDIRVTPDAQALRFAGDETVRLQAHEMLAGAGRRDAQPRADIGGGLRSARLELEQDPVVARCRHCHLTLHRRR